MTNRKMLGLLQRELHQEINKGVPSGTGILFRAMITIIGVLLGNDAAQTVSDEKPALKVGERVRLASGGPEMTVIGYPSPMSTARDSDVAPGADPITRAGWFGADGAYHHQVFPAAALSRTEDRLKQIEAKREHREMLGRAHQALVDIRVSKDRLDVDHEAIAARALAAEDELAAELFG